MHRNVAFGRWLKERRKAQDLTQENLAELAGCATETIRKIEAGVLRPSKQIAERLADILNVPDAERAAFVRLARAATPTTEPAPPPAEHELINPYKGLRPFMEADAADFFGREALTQYLLARLAEETALARFLAVVGPSGSGKSSVVRAGLIPALRGGALPGAEGWLVTTVFPGAHPLEELEAGLLRVVPNPPPSLLAQLQEEQHGLLRAVKRTLPADTATELVLVIDQFEELFTLVTDERTRLHILNSLYDAVTDPRSRLRVIITLRADFYDRPLLYAGFGDLMRQRTAVVLPFAPEDLLRAIIRPAERAGGSLEADLVATIMNDVSAQPGLLPLLQYALTELFERRSGHTLTLDAYHASGGVSGALARRADDIYAGLSAPQQELARQLFLRLVTPGEGMEDTRRRIRRAELATAALTDDDAASAALNPSASMDKIIDAYGKYRLLTFDRDPITHDSTVEVAHESLIRAWGRLRQWLDSSREELLLQRRLTAAAAEWTDAARDPSFLATGARLEQLSTWAATTSLALNQQEQEYLDASLAEQRAQQRQVAARQARETALERRSRNVLRVLVVVLLLATVGALALTRLALDNADEARTQALVAGAQAALNEGNTDMALALALRATQGDSKAAQSVLAAAAYAPGTRQRFVGPAGVKTVVFSPDGRSALSASDDKTLILWDVASGTKIRTFVGHTDVVQSAVFSPDGRSALSASDDKTLILWDVATGTKIRSFQQEHTAAVQSAVFSPDGRSALSASDDKTLILWDVAGGTPIRRFAGHKDEVKTVAFSPDGRSALSGSDDKTLILWDVASGAQLRSFVGHTAGVNAVAFSPDGRSALSASDDKTLILWDVASGAQLRSFVGHTGEVNAIAFSADGRTALSGSQDTTVRLWDIATGASIRTLIGHGATVNSVAFSPNSHTVLSASTDRDLRLWDIDNGAELRRLDGHADGVERVTFSHDGQYILSAADDQTLILWDAAKHQLLHTLKGHSSQVYGAAFSPDDRLVLSASGDQTLILWDVASGMKIRSFVGHTNSVLSVAFSPDGRTALSGSADKTMILWDVASGKPLLSFRGHTSSVQSVAFSADGRTALSGSGDQTLILWDVASGAQLRSFVGHSAPVRDVAFSPDGRMALSGSTDRTMVLWDVATGQPLRSFVGHHGAVLSVTFSPDGRTAASGSFDNNVILWDIASGQPLRRFAGHTAPVRDVAFSPDGHSILSGSLDNSLRLWRIDSRDELIAWTKANRSIPSLPCDQLKLYRLVADCPVTSSTATPH
jgi:WD40 repeat protein/transcriptional regulator with XRE-family HTH domain